MSWTKGLGRPPEIIWRQSFFEEGWSSTWMGHSDACTVIWAPILSLSQLSEIFLINYSATFDPGCIFCELLGNNSIMSKADNAQWVSWFLFLDSTQFFNIKIFSKFTQKLILIIMKTFWPLNMCVLTINSEIRIYWRCHWPPSATSLEESSIVGVDWMQTWEWQQQAALRGKK